MRPRLRLAVLAAGGVLAVALAARWAAGAGLADAEAAQRFGTAAVGGLLLLFGNGWPKHLAMAGGVCSPGAVDRLTRLTGWLFVLTGLAVLAGAAFAPAAWLMPLVVIPVLAGAGTLAFETRRLRQRRTGHEGS